MRTVNIAIFASGSGSNAQNLINYLNSLSFSVSSNSGIIEVKPVVVLSNKADALVLERAERLGIDRFVFNAKDLRDGDVVDKLLTAYKIDFIVLAGFLLKLPDRLVERFRGQVLNLHPSLLPKFGGKGMYGDNVHRAVIESGDTESGITVHVVDEKYDNGHIIFQAKCSVEQGETPASLAAKIHLLEQTHFPSVVADYIVKRFSA